MIAAASTGPPDPSILAWVSTVLWLAAAACVLWLAAWIIGWGFKGHR